MLVFSYCKIYLGNDLKHNHSTSKGSGLIFLVKLVCIFSILEEIHALRGESSSGILIVFLFCGALWHNTHIHYNQEATGDHNSW